MASYFSDLDESIQTPNKSKTDYFSDLSEEPSVLRSALSAPLKGALRQQATGINLFAPRGPVSPELGEKLIEKFLPTRAEHKPFERAAKIGAELAISGVTNPLELALATTGGTAGGELAEKAGYGEFGQNVSETIGMGLPGLAKVLGQKGAQLAKGIAGRFKGGINPIETPAGRTGYELAEKALKVLEKPPVEKPIQGFEFPTIEPEGAKSLTGRAKVIDTSIGKEISTDKFYNEKHGGINLSGNVKSEAKLERKPFEKKYKLAEQEFKGKGDIYANLANENDQLIARLEEIPERNTGEEAVYKKAQALRKMIGSKDNLIEAPLSSLLKYSDSISGIANFDMPYVGPKGLLKGMAKGLNKAVIEAAERQGLNTKHMLEADALYSKWADRFLNDEISPYLAHKTRNPERLFRDALKDEGAYRALRDAIEKKHPKSMDKLERSIVEVKIKPYAEDISKVGSPKFKEDMANLEGLIGKEKANKVKKSLLKEQTRPRPRSLEKGTPITERVKKGFVGETPEKIESMMNSRSGIRELRKELKARGQEALFDEMAEDKALDILRGGVVSPEKIRGIDMFHQVRQKHNYDILSEIYGKKSVDNFLIDLSKINKKNIKLEQLKKLGKYAGTWVGAAKLLKVISVFI